MYRKNGSYTELFTGSTNVGKCKIKDQCSAPNNLGSSNCDPAFDYVCCKTLPGGV